MSALNPIRFGALHFYQAPPEDPVSDRLLSDLAKIQADHPDEVFIGHAKVQESKPALNAIYVAVPDRIDARPIDAQVMATIQENRPARSVYSVEASRGSGNFTRMSREPEVIVTGNDDTHQFRARTATDSFYMV